MKINIEGQAICAKYLRGISQFTLNIIKSLVLRKANHYSISFFDYLKERNNREYLYRNIPPFILEKMDIYECNSKSYKDFIISSSLNDFEKYSSTTYESCFDNELTFDLCYFTHSWSMFPNPPRNSVFTIHDIIPLIPDSCCGLDSSLINRFDNIHKYLRNRSDIIFTVDSQFTKNDIMNCLKISDERIYVTLLGYDNKIIYPETNRDIICKFVINKPYILYLGCVCDQRKRVEDILDAFRIIKDRHYDIQLVLSGQYIINNEFSKNIEYKINNHKYKDDIIITGIITEDEKRALLSSAEAFVFPSIYEGFGLPVLEAMACGSPVITTNVTSLPEVGGDAVMYVSPKQPEEIAVSLIKLLDSEELRQEYIQKGFERAKLFSWDKTAELTEKVFEIAYNMKNS